MFFEGGEPSSHVDFIRQPGLLSAGHALSNLRSNLFIVLYADDIILVAPTVGQLQSLFNSCQEVLDSLDMKINSPKISLHENRPPLRCEVCRNP